MQDWPAYLAKAVMNAHSFIEDAARATGLVYQNLLNITSVLGL